MVIPQNLEEQKNRISKLMSEQITMLGGISPILSPKNAVKAADWVKSWNVKDWLSFVEITSGILGSIPSPASPVLLGVSLGAGLANAKIYYDEGDPYTAGMILAFNLLPAGELIRQLKNSKTFMKLGKNQSIKLLETVKKGNATQPQRKLAEQLVKEVAPLSKDLAKSVSIETIRKILAALPKQSMSFILKLCMAMLKLGVFGIATGVTISGIFLTYDKLYRALNYKNEKNLSSREKNEMVKLYNLIMNNEDEIKNKLVQEIKNVEPLIIKNSDIFISIDTTYPIKFQKYEK